MDVLYILLPISVALAVVIALVFFLSVRSGQFDDLEGPAYRLLDDNDDPRPGSVKRDRSDAKGPDID